MTDHDTALVPRVDNAPLAYGERPQVRSLAARIMSMDPSYAQIGERGVLLKAQLGIALGLNPLPGTGHIHVWVDKRGNLAVHIGLEGRLALARKDSPFSVTTRPMRAEELDYHGVQPHDRGAIAELYRHDVTQAATRLGIPVKPATGVGIARNGEDVPRGRSLAWRAEQRAIKDAIRLSFSFSLPSAALEVIRDAGAAYVEQGEVVEAEFGESDAGAAAGDTQERAQAANQALYGEWPAAVVAAGEDAPPEEPPAPPVVEERPAPKPNGNGRPYAPELVKSKILAGAMTKHKGAAASNKQRALFVSQLNHCFAGDARAEEKRRSVIKYLFRVGSSKDVEDAEVLATIDWLAPAQDSGGAWAPSPMAAREAGLIVREALKAAGQAELPMGGEAA